MLHVDEIFKDYRPFKKPPFMARNKAYFNKYCAMIDWNIYTRTIPQEVFDKLSVKEIKQLACTSVQIKSKIKEKIKENGRYMDKIVKENRNANKNTRIYNELRINDVIKETLELKQALKLTDNKEIINNGVSDEDIARAKEYPITDLIEFNRGGFARCLWHEPDNNPSMHYWREKNIAHCFSCGKHGDSIEVYMTLNEVDFINSIKNLI